MSSQLDQHALESIAAHRIQHYIREAEIDHLQSELHPRKGHWLLLHLGHALTSLGRRMENLDRQDARPSGESDAIGAAVPNR